jgi:hypothetical protein
VFDVDKYARPSKLGRELNQPLKILRGFVYIGVRATVAAGNEGEMSVHDAVAVTVVAKFIGIIGRCKILVDGVAIQDKIGSHETVQFRTPPGRHAFQAQFGLKTPALVLECVAGESITLVLRKGIARNLGLEVLSRTGPSPRLAPAPSPPMQVGQPGAARHIFISYSRTDGTYVQKLAQVLTAAGLPVWYDRALVPGQSFSKDIEKAIDTCFAMVVVLTPSSVDSDWVRLELSRARRLNKPIWPLYLAPCQPPIEVEGLQAESVPGGGEPSAWFVESLAGLYRATVPHAT